MKKILILLLAVPFLSMTVQNEKEKFIGKWIGVDQNEVGYLTFDEEGYAQLELQGEVFGGKEFEMNGEKGQMTYEVVSSTNPIHLNLVVTKFESGEESKLFCIAKFTDEDTMQFALSFSGNRPTKFNTENSLVFKRDK